MSIRWNIFQWKCNRFNWSTIKKRTASGERIKMQFKWTHQTRKRKKSAFVSFHFSHSPSFINRIDSVITTSNYSPSWIDALRVYRVGSPVHSTQFRFAVCLKCFEEIVVAHAWTTQSVRTQSRPHETVFFADSIFQSSSFILIDDDATKVGKRSKRI